MSINDKFESQEFYELMQTYRHSKTNEDTVKAFENVKEYATAQSQQELATQQLRIEQLESALMAASKYVDHFDPASTICKIISEALSTPTTTTHLDDYVISRLEQVATVKVVHISGDNYELEAEFIPPVNVGNLTPLYRLKESDK